MVLPAFSLVALVASAAGGQLPRAGPASQLPAALGRRVPELACVMPAWEGPPLADDGLTSELDEAWEVDFGKLEDEVFSDTVPSNELLHGPSTSPSTPPPPAPQEEGTAPLSVCKVWSMGVAKVCQIDESSVKKPLFMEWTQSREQVGLEAGEARNQSLVDFETDRALKFHHLHPPVPVETEPMGLSPMQRVAWVAAKLHVSVEDFLCGVNHDLSQMDHFAALAVQEDDGTRLDPDQLPGVTAMLEPLPVLPQPPDRPAPATTVEGPVTEGLTAHFSGKFSFISMFLNPDEARKALNEWEAQTKADAARCFAALREGRAPKVPCRDPLIFLPEDFQPCLVGRSIDTSNHDACFVTSDHDREAHHFTSDGKLAETIDHARVASDLGGKAFPDQEFLHSLRYGHDSKSTQPWALILCSMNKSAALNLPLVAKAIDAGILKGWQDTSTHITAVPSVFEPFGVAYKKHSVDPATGKRKPRLTTDKSGPRKVTDANGHPLADNECIDLLEHAETKLPRASDIRQAVEVLGAMARSVMPAVRAAAATPAEAERAAEALEVDLGTDDCAAYFSQFGVRHRSIARQGIVLPRENGSLTYSFSRRVQFGGKSSPAFSMRMTGALLHRLGVLTDVTEKRLAQDAEAFERDPSQGSAAAARASPKPLRDLLKRRELLGLSARATWTAGYIDDLILCSIGRVRGIALLHNLWSIAEAWNVPIAKGKAAFGSDTTIIGYRFLTRSNIFSLTANKVHLLKCWCKRLKALRGCKVTVKEFESLAGQLVWARAALPTSGKFIRRIFSLAARPEHSVYQPGWLRHDLQCIEDVLDQDRGAMMISRPPPPLISHPTNVAWSDACREPGGQFSGMGGFSPKGGGLLWSYKFSEHHLQHCPIHVLEAVGEVVNLGFVAQASCLDTEEGEAPVCLQYCDNMSWVASVTGGKPTDPRLREILQVRHAIQDRFNLTAHVHYVNTHVNTVADLVSRGDTEEAKQHLVEHGWNAERLRSIERCS